MTRHPKTCSAALLGLLTLITTLLAPFAPATPVQAQAAYQDGDLLQAPDDDKIYLIQAGRRRWIADTTSLQRLSPDFARLRRVSFEELDRLPAGKPYRELPLIRDAASGRVYLLTQETGWRAPRKHWINDLDSFTRLGFDWGDVTTDWPTPPEQYADAPALTYRPISRAQTTFANQQGTFSVVPAWRLQTQDERLLMGLILADTYNVEWREQIAPRLAPQGTWIEWGDLPEGAAGVFRPRLNRIQVSRTLEGEGFGVIAAVLTHEVYHAVTTHGSDATACFAEEVDAFTWEAKTWSSLPAQWRSSGLWGQMLDGLVHTWRAQRLQQLVTGDEDYQHECAR